MQALQRHLQMSCADPGQLLPGYALSMCSISAICESFGRTYKSHGVQASPSPLKPPSRPTKLLSQMMRRRLFPQLSARHLRPQAQRQLPQHLITLLKICRMALLSRATALPKILQVRFMPASPQKILHTCHSHIHRHNCEKQYASIQFPSCFIMPTLELL